mmetsp:Transcript_57127/g.169857  ORF Transcript_57127/g.169857 Transcript_57127/m.169857 type:complete len:235 (-) Transcript_57127:188-892(-)
MRPDLRPDDLEPDDQPAARHSTLNHSKPRPGLQDNFRFILEYGDGRHTAAHLLADATDLKHHGTPRECLCHAALRRDRGERRPHHDVAMIVGDAVKAVLSSVEDGLTGDTRRERQGLNGPLEIVRAVLVVRRWRLWTAGVAKLAVEVPVDRRARARVCACRHLLRRRHLVHLRDAERLLELVPRDALPYHLALEAIGSLRERFRRWRRCHRRLRCRRATAYVLVAVGTTHSSWR